jgi:hypothetical protein
MENFNGECGMTIEAALKILGIKPEPLPELPEWQEQAEIRRKHTTTSERIWIKQIAERKR